MSTLHRCVAAVILAVLVSAQVFGDSPPSPTLTVRGAGIGADKDAALRDALGDAVLVVAGVVLDESTFKKHKATIVKNVVPKAADLVKSHEVLKSENTADGKVSVRVRATVDREAVIAKLADAGVAVAKPAEGPADSGLGEKVLKFCKDKVGQQVGDGECGTLAQEALAAAGAAPVNTFKENPGGGDFVWGELVFALEAKDGKRKRDPVGAKAIPGDVVQYRDALFRGSQGGRPYIFLASHHTAVVVEVKKNGDLVVLEQNMNGKKEVSQATVRVNDLSGGWLRVYRPVPK
jgi:hypothetical protein